MTDNAPLFTALTKFQKSMEHIHKDKTANTGKYGYKYADIAGVIEAVKEPLADNGLCYMQVLTGESGRPALRTILAHESGASIEGTMPLQGDLNDPQKLGGVITYTRRYALLGILGLATDDDDAQSISRSQPDLRPGAHKPITRDSPHITPPQRPGASQSADEDMTWTEFWRNVRPGIPDREQLELFLGQSIDGYTPATVYAMVKTKEEGSTNAPNTRFARPQPTNNPNGITPAQLTFVRELLLKKGMDDKAWPAWAMWTLGVGTAPDVSDLTKTQATKVIDELKGMPDNPNMQAILEASGR